MFLRINLQSAPHQKQAPRLILPLPRGTPPFQPFLSFSPLPCKAFCPPPHLGALSFPLLLFCFLPLLLSFQTSLLSIKARPAIRKHSRWLCAPYLPALSCQCPRSTKYALYPLYRPWLQLSQPFHAFRLFQIPL